MIRGSVRMIDDSAQSTGLVVKIGDQRRELCFGNRIHRGHKLARYKFAIELVHCPFSDEIPALGTPPAAGTAGAG
jgi:hypothetical protein